jgi:hypothetical protein
MMRRLQLAIALQSVMLVAGAQSIASYHQPHANHIGVCLML